MVEKGVWSAVLEPRPLVEEGWVVNGKRGREVGSLAVERERGDVTS